MSKFKLNRNFLVGLSPWTILGAVLILSVVFLFMTFDNINRQREKTTRILTEKGAALIRSFEAGARSGMMFMHFGGDQVQNLLEETAQQPDIVYLIVTDVRGNVLAHNNPAQIMSRHGADLDLARIARSRTVEWRRVRLSDGKTVFEVYRQFGPMVGRPSRPRGRIMESDWFWPHITLNRPGGPGQIIFVGFDLEPFEAAQRRDAVHTVVMALILLLIGFAGMVTLFLAQAYQATKASLFRVQAFSDNLVANMPVGLLALDPQGKIVSFNQAAESILGLSFQELYGRDADRMLPQILLDLMDEIDGGTETVEREVDCPAADGKQIPLDVSAALLRDGEGTFMGHLILFRDLTEMQALRDEVERNKRLASLGSLAAGVAHEIRNPLSSIKGFATYFKERYQDVPEDQKTAGIMIQEVERLNRVVTQLLEFAGPMTVQKKPVPALDLIRHSLDVIRSQAEAGQVRIETDLDAAIGEINVDQDKINQVLLNLYVNAIEAMEAGGLLRVGLTRDNGQGIRITVSDTGSGIDRENLPHIFDPYFTTKTSGTGLGLAIVSKIVEAHGGEIKAFSQPGRGTQIQVSLPAKTAG